MKKSYKRKITESKMLRKNLSKDGINENDIKLSNMDNILRFSRGYDRIKVTYKKEGLGGSSCDVSTKAEVSEFAVNDD